MPAPLASYVERDARHLVLTSDAYVPVLKHAAQLTGGVALFIHTHPEHEPRASQADDKVDEALRPVFQLRTGQSVYGSLVLRMERGELTFSGRAWRERRFLGSISLMREIGLRIRVRSAVDDPDPVPPPAHFDRQIRAFGPEFQELIGKLHVGIVGAGGTGSAVGEQLIRLGVGTISVVDYQTIDADGSNVTRVYGSGMSSRRKPKTAVLRKSARRIGLGTRVVEVSGNVRSRQVAEALRDCDVIFGCTDDHAGRAILSRLAYWYLVPVFDMAFMVDKNPDQTIRGLEGRVSTMLPGLACLFCLDVIDTDLLTAEELPRDEYERRRRDGYVPGLNEADPAVVPYTTMVAAFAVNELIERLVGFADRAPGELRVRVHDRKLSPSATASDPGHFCADRDNWGAGDREPFLGRSLWP